MGAKEDTNIPAPKTDKTEGRNARTGKTVSKTGTIKGSKGGKEEKVNTEQINSCAPEPMTAKEKRQSKVNGKLTDAARRDAKDQNTTRRESRWYQRAASRDRRESAESKKIPQDQWHQAKKGSQEAQQQIPSSNTAPVETQDPGALYKVNRADLGRQMFENVSMGAQKGQKRAEQFVNTLEKGEKTQSGGVIKGLFGKKIVPAPKEENTKVKAPVTPIALPGNGATGLHLSASPDHTASRKNLLDQMKAMVTSKYKTPPVKPEIGGAPYKRQRTDAACQDHTSPVKTNSPGSIVISITGNIFTNYNQTCPNLEPPVPPSQLPAPASSQISGAPQISPQRDLNGATGQLDCLTGTINRTGGIVDYHSALKDARAKYGTSNQKTPANFSKIEQLDPNQQSQLSQAICLNLAMSGILDQLAESSPGSPAKGAPGQISRSEEYQASQELPARSCYTGAPLSTRAGQGNNAPSDSNSNQAGVKPGMVVTNRVSPLEVVMELQSKNLGAKIETGAFNKGTFTQPLLAGAPKPPCQRCTGAGRTYQAQVQEARIQAPWARLKDAEDQLSAANARWGALGERIEATMRDIEGYRMVNRDLMFASDANLKLRAKNQKLVDVMTAQKARARAVINRMRQEMVELHVQAGKSQFSAGFHSALATDDNRQIAKFLDPGAEFSPSKSLGGSSASESCPDETQIVMRALALNQIPADEILERLNPILAAEKEKAETNALLPLIAAELKTINWAEHQQEESTSQDVGAPVKVDGDSQLRVPPPDADDSKAPATSEMGPISLAGASNSQGARLNKMSGRGTLKDGQTPLVRI